MDCERAQEAILESFDGSQAADVWAALDAHVAGCSACALFAERHLALDRRLTSILVAPATSSTFRDTLRERIRQDARPFWSDLLPDVVHFGSCGVVTLLGIVLLPVGAPLVLTVAVIGTLLTHAVLTAARESLDAVEESGS